MNASWERSRRPRTRARRWRQRLRFPPLRRAPGRLARFLRSRAARPATVTAMFGGLNRLLAAAIVAGAVLVLPPAALADCGGNASAVNVYKECLSSGGGGKATTGSTGKPTSGGS